MEALLGSIGLDLTKNLSLYTVPAVFVLCLAPGAYAALSAGKSFDPAYPRTLQGNVSNDASVDKARAQRILRAKAAGDNGFETLGFFAAAVAAANHAGVDAGTLNGLTLGYVASRVLYIFSYVELGANRKLSGARSVAWTVGVVLVMTLWVKAGNKVLAA